MQCYPRVVKGVAGLLAWVLGLAMPAIVFAAAGSVTYQYDDAGRLKTTTYNDGTANAYTLDAAGNRTQTQAVLGAGVMQLSAATANVSEDTTPFTITVARTGTTAGAVSVNYSTANGTATAGSDYTATSGALNWASGDGAAKNISVPITNDTALESSETFTITLSAPTGGAQLGAITQATVTITDNDSVSFSIANISVNENAGTATFTVTKSGSTGLTHDVNFATANGVATAGSDYTAASGTLSFAPADTSKTFTVTLADDTTYEGNETFTATLNSPTNGATLGTSTATATVVDNDGVSFSIANSSFNENSGYGAFTVSKNGTSSLTHTVNFTTANGTATAGSDYTAASGTLSFAPGDTTQYIVVTLIDESTYEPNETLSASLSAPSNGATLGTATGTMTIVNDDPVPPAGTLQFVNLYQSVPEAGGSIAVQVSRINGSYGAASAVCSTFSTDGAQPGSDYTATTTTLNWANDDTASKSCTVPILTDTIYEYYCPDPVNGNCPGSTEPFLVQLSSVSGATLGAPAIAQVDIIDDEPPPDTYAPTVPGGLSATRVSATQVNLSWSASTDTGGSGLAGYKIYRAGVQIATTTATTYSDSPMTSNFAYTVKAYDNATPTNNESAPSAPATPVDNIAPSVPTGLSATAASSTQINLSWTASSDTGGSGLSNYVVYRNGGFLANTAATSLSDTGLTPSTNYTYAVLATDVAGNQSAQSTSAAATTMPPPIPTDNFSMGSSEWYVEQEFSFLVLRGINGPISLTGGKTVTGFYDDTTTVQSVISVSGFSSDPGQGWLVSASAAGVTKSGASAGYSYQPGTGQANWFWPTLFGFPASGTVSGSIVHSP